MGAHIYIPGKFRETPVSFGFCVHSPVCPVSPVKSGIATSSVKAPKTDLLPSMPELPLPGKYHCNVALVRCGDDFRVPH